jgi:hypothetical protein
MEKLTKTAIGATLLVTLVVLVTWQVTGGDYYTKFEVVEQVEKQVDPNDPLAQAGFYDGSTQTETVTRDAFRFGLLPTPGGLFDKHILSVLSIATPFWLLSLGLLWRSRRRTQQAAYPT